MAFFAYLKQKGDGCDYTIACGEILIKLSSETLYDSKKELKDIIKENYYGDLELDSAKIIEGKLININLEHIYSEMKKEEQQKKQQEQEEQDKILYNKLKERFEK